MRSPDNTVPPSRDDIHIFYTPVLARRGATPVYSSPRLVGGQGGIGDDYDKSSDGAETTPPNWAPLTIAMEIEPVVCHDQPLIDGLQNE